MSQTLVFNGAPKGKIPYTFSRAVNTVDDDGNAVAPGVMRFGKSRTVASTPKWLSEAIPLNGGSFLQQGLTMGQYDFDGSTPLTVMYEVGVPRVRIFRGKLDFQGAAETSRAMARADHAGASDLLNGLANQDAAVAYDPYAFRICHGFIMAACQRYAWTGTVWESRGISILYTQDYGATWVKHYHSPDIVPGKNRGNFFALGNYAPVDSVPTDVWWSVVDYETSAAGAQCGQCVIFRMTRTGVGATWTPQAGYLVYTVTDSSITHFHCAVVAVKNHLTPKRIDVVVSQGDAQLNRGIRLCCNDPANYTNSANWDAPDTTQGNSNDPELGYATSQANQWVAGLSIGYASSEFFVNADIERSNVWRMVVPDAKSAKLEYTGVQGLHVNNTSDGLCLFSVAPERNGPYFGIDDAMAGSLGAAAYRVIWSPDGVSWTTIGEQATANKYPFWHAGRIYVVGTNTPNQPYPYMVAPIADYRKVLRLGPGSWGENNWINPSAPLRSGFWDNAFNTVTLNIVPDVAPPSLGSKAHITSPGVDGTNAHYAGVITLNSPDPIPTPAGKWCYRCFARNKQAPKATVLDAIRHWDFSVIDFGVYNYHDRQWRPWVTPIAPISNDTIVLSWHNSLNYTNDCYITDREHVNDVLLHHATEQPYPGYSVAPQTTGPDELFAMQPAGMAAQWTFLASCFVPSDSWSSEYAAKWTTNPAFFTVFGNATNYVYLSFDLVNGRLQIDVDSAGTVTSGFITGLVFHPSDVLKIAVTQSGSAVEISLQVGGGTIKTQTIAATMAVIPVEIRFARPDNSRAAAIDLAACYVDSVYSDATAREALVQQLFFPTATGNSSFARTRPGRNPRVARV